MKNRTEVVDIKSGQFLDPKGSTWTLGSTTLVEDLIWHFINLLDLPDDFGQMRALFVKVKAKIRALWLIKFFGTSCPNLVFRPHIPR